MTAIRFLPRSKIVRLLLISLGIVVCIGLIASWIVGSQLIAPKPLDVGRPPPDFPAKHFTLDSASGEKISGWNCRAPNSRGVVLLLHGIRESRLKMLDRARFLYTHGYSIVMIDFQSHGESTGDAITMGALEKEDVRATVEFVKRSHPEEKIAVLGVSLGGAAAALANPSQIDAMILESVFPSIQAAVHNRVNARLAMVSYLPAEILLFQLNARLKIKTDEICPISNLPEISCPIYILSGKSDPHTTAEETRQMYEAVAGPKKLWLVDGADHVDLHGFAKEDYELRLLQFLDESLGTDE